MRRVLPVIFLCLALGASAAGLPAPYRAVLAKLSADVPRGWAYTTTTTRNGDTSVERFDPARPHEEQWTLLARNGQPPTATEAARYRSYRVTTSTSTLRATFERGDIDPATAELVSEDDARAVYRCKFRQDVDDAMLNHLELTLVFRKEPAAVEKFTLYLTEPFSPVLGMKMQSLTVETTLSAATTESPALPRESLSRFHGRVLFFKSVDEEVRVAYSDFRRAETAATDGRRR
ncbi:MAG: hypothetical protein HYV95_15920 [Opitutae bacterium]|nr:hypothetical protein [Opitutae bacterium]